MGKKRSGDAFAKVTLAYAATSVPVSHGAVFGAAKLIASHAGVPPHMRARNKKPASADFSRVFYTVIESRQRNRWCRGPDSNRQAS